MCYVRKLGLLVLAAFAVACTCSLALVSPAGAADAAAATAAPSISVSGSLTHVFKGEPGQVLTGEIHVVNSGDAVAQTRLYLNDYMYHADGTTVYGEPGTTDRSSAGWVTLHSELVAVPPRSVLAVPYSVQVPAGAAAGSHWCLVMVEQADQGSVAPPQLDAADNAQPSQPVARIVARVRYGVQIVIDIGQGSAGVEVLDAGVDRRDAADSPYVLHLDVQNTGDVRLVPTMRVWAYDGRGQNVGMFEGSRTGLVPGSSARFETALPGIAPGDYAVLVVLESDAGSWGVQYDLKL